MNEISTEGPAGRLRAQGRRSAARHPSAEEAVPAGGGGDLEPGVQGLRPQRLRAGEQAISVPRLQRLARFYNVPVDQPLPGGRGPDFGIARDDDEGRRPPTSRLATQPGFNSVTIDLTRLESLTGPEADMLNRYLTMIQVQRRDFNGRVLTIPPGRPAGHRLHPRHGRRRRGQPPRRPQAGLGPQQEVAPGPPPAASVSSVGSPARPSRRPSIPGAARCPLRRLRARAVHAVRCDYCVRHLGRPGGPDPAPPGGVPHPGRARGWRACPGHQRVRRRWHALAGPGRPASWRCSSRCRSRPVPR